MLMCDEEGPFPLEGDCTDVLLLKQGDFLQAFMVLDNLRVIPTPEGFTPMGYLTPMDGIEGQLAPLADVEFGRSNQMEVSLRNYRISGSGRWKATMQE